MWAFQRGHVPICCLKTRFFLCFFAGGFTTKISCLSVFSPKPVAGFRNPGLHQPASWEQSRLRVNDGTKAKRVGWKLGSGIHQLMEEIHQLIQLLFRPGFVHARWLFRISEPSTVPWVFLSQVTSWWLVKGGYIQINYMSWLASSSRNRCTWNYFFSCLTSLIIAQQV